MDSKLSKLSIGVQNWAIDLEQSQKCPYAKPALDKDKVKIKILDFESAFDFWTCVHTEAELFDDSRDVVMIAMETNSEIITAMQLAGGCDSLNSGFNNRKINLWALHLCDDLYTIILLQKLTKLDNASRILEKKDYYQNHIPYMYNKYVLQRRQMREKLNE